MPLGQATVLPAMAEGIAGVPGLTITSIALLLAKEGDMHEALEVILTLTLSPLAKVELVNVGLFEPTVAPLTLHW